MTDLHNSSLGKKTEYNGPYNPDLLFAIDRKLRRDTINQAWDQAPFYGCDIWNIYEISWLKPDGRTAVAMGKLCYPANSPRLVESKSLKLYLGSIGNSIFENDADVSENITKDLTTLLGCHVEFTLLPLNTISHEQILPPGLSIDQTSLIEPIPDFASRTDVFSQSHSEGSINFTKETLHCNLFRSNCPVTNQPDWATIIIDYSGQKISNSALLAYLLSYRMVQQLHEECAERIYFDLFTHLKLQHLTVAARYTRRGGIDINPVRSNTKEYHSYDFRLIRQ